MLKFNVEHFDDFENGDYVCWLTASGVPDDYVKKAKEIDKENYLDECFGICVNSEKFDFCICQGDIDCELYYIDNDGNKNWMDYILSPEENKDAIGLCKVYLGISL
jgi:hypothetical protein